MKKESLSCVREVAIGSNRFVEVERSVVFGIQADGFVGIVFLGDEDGGEIGAELFEVIPFRLIEAEEFFLVVFFGGLVFFEESQGLVVLLLFLLEEVKLVLLLFLSLFGGPLVFAGLFEVGEFLLLVFDFGFENTEELRQLFLEVSDSFQVCVVFVQIVQTSIKQVCDFRNRRLRLGETID